MSDEATIQCCASDDPAAGLNVSLVLQTACAETNIDPEVRDRTVDVLVRHIEEALHFQREYSAKNKRYTG